MIAMRRIDLVTLGLVLFAHSAPAAALDCRQASSSVDKLICTTPDLKKTDEEMSAAYFKLLKDTTDADFREALIKSQRRWLKVRERGPDRIGQAQDDKTDDRDVLLGMTRQRLDFLRTGVLVRTMEQEREALSRDSGGPFAGFRSYCVLQPPPYASWVYECWGDAHRQNKDRVCSSVKEWASGHMTESRRASVVKAAELKLVAHCAQGYAAAGEECTDPDEDGETASAFRWYKNSLPPTPVPARGELWKYDPDIEPDVVSRRWMQDCLFAPVYPPHETPAKH